MDLRSFAIIIILTTIISYLFIRRYFKIAPRYIVYACLGIILGLFVGVVFALPIKVFLGELGIVVAPYVMGIVLMVFIEFFIIEGLGIVKNIKSRYGIR